MSKYVSDTNAGSTISAYVILNKRGEYVAKVQFYHGNVCTVNVFQSGKELERSQAAAVLAHGKLPKDGMSFQHGRASGSGYDKATAALSGLFIDGHVMTDHCSKQGAPKPPKGRKLYPRDARAKAGYYFANSSRVRKSDGKNIHLSDFREKAIEKLGEQAPFDDIKALMFKLETDFLSSDDCESGYSSCFREPGLKYLESIGYRVIQAI